MFHRFSLAAVAALSLALVASVPVSAATPTAAPVTKDANGKCHDASGKYTSCATAASTSASSVTKDANGKCHDASGKYTKCPTTSKSTSNSMKSTTTKPSDSMKAASPAPAHM